MIPSLTREQILDCVDGRPVSVDVPGWGTLYVRPWTVSEFIDIHNHYESAGDAQGDRALIDVIHSVCDADGNMLLSMDDLPALRTKRGRAILAISKAIARVNGEGDDMEKNSETTQS